MITDIERTSTSEKIFEIWWYYSYIRYGSHGGKDKQNDQFDWHQLSHIWRDKMKDLLYVTKMHLPVFSTKP